MKRKSFTVKFITLCLVCFILVTPLTINAVPYSVTEDGAVMAGSPKNERIYTIYTQTNKVFDVINGLTANNSEVWTYTYSGAKCQEWKFIFVSSTDDGELVYAIQDTNSGKFLTAVNSSSASGSDFVITAKPSSGYSTSQLFIVQQIGTSMRYRILTKYSNYTQAIGYNSSGYLRQLSTSDSTTQLYLKESAPYHGLQEGFVHIQKYTTTYSSNDQFLGVDVDNNALNYTLYNNSTAFDWYVVYRGDGYYTISSNGYYLYSTGTSAGHAVATTGNYSESNCLWKIINNGSYYQFAPKSAVSNNSYSAVLGVANNTPKLVASTAGRWRVIRSNNYNDYDMTIYACEDYSHSNNYGSHADILNYACSALYVKGKDNQKLIFNTGEPDETVSSINSLLESSMFFVLRSHGASQSFLLNASDGNGDPIGEESLYNISEINRLNTNLLSNLYCVMFISCHSAEGAYNSNTATNFVKSIVTKGAKSAIGFDGVVNCQKASSFASVFFDYYADPDNNGAMNALARLAFLDAVDQTAGLYGDNYKPYFWNGSVSEKIN